MLLTTISVRSTASQKSRLNLYFSDSQNAYVTAREMFSVMSQISYNERNVHSNQRRSSGLSDVESPCGITSLCVIVKSLLFLRMISSKFHSESVWREESDSKMVKCVPMNILCGNMKTVNFLSFRCCTVATENKFSFVLILLRFRKGMMGSHL